MTEITASENLIDKKLINHGRPLDEISRKTQWLERDPYGKFTVSSAVGTELRKVFEV